MRSSDIRLIKLKLRLRDNCLLSTRSPEPPSCRNSCSRSWIFGDAASRIVILIGDYSTTELTSDVTTIALYTVYCMGGQKDRQRRITCPGSRPALFFSGPTTRYAAMESFTEGERELGVTSRVE